MWATKPRRAAVALIAGAALFLSACGDDDDDEGSSSEPALTGAPIDIGFINTENSPAGSYPDFRVGAEAAVKYINQELGGVNGRPIDMETCTVDGTGERSIACANQFVQSGKVAVSYGLDFGGAGSTPVFAQAALPVLGGAPTETTQLTSTNNFAFIGAVAGAVPATSRYVAEEIKPKKVAIIAADIPAGHLAVEQFSKTVFAKAGITDVNDVYEAPTAADLTPVLTKANEGNPDAILLFFGGLACSKFMQASHTLGIPTSKMFYLYVCAAREQLDAGGAGAQGINVQSSWLSPDSDDPDVEVYKDAMDAADASELLGPNSQSGFSSIMNIYALMKGIAGEITRESVTTAVQATVNQPSFMAHPYTCDGKQIPGLPGLCSASDRIFTYEDGKFVDVKGDWVEGVSLLGP